MAYLKNHIIAIGPFVDPRISQDVHINMDCVIPEEIRTAMGMVLKAVADQMEKEHLIGRERTSITCLFLESDHFEICLDPGEIAICMKLAIYPLPNLTPYIHSTTLFTILAEELCHLIWGIKDETLVNVKVLEVLQNLNPTFTMKDLGYLEQ